MNFFNSASKWIGTLLFGRRAEDTALQAMLLGIPRTGKSTFGNAVVEAVLDPAAPRIGRGFVFEPHEEMRTGHDYPDKTVGAPVPFKGWVNCGGRPLPFTLVDPSGEDTRLLREDADDADEPTAEQAQAFYEALHASDLLILALDLAEVLERPREQLDQELRQLAALPTRAIDERRCQDKRTAVAIVFTKTDEAGCPRAGRTRVVGEDPRVRAALETLRDAPQAEVPARLRDFIAAAALDPDGVPEWTALRRALLERTSILWDALVRCQNIDVRDLNGYLVQARPVELDETWSMPWARRGVLEVFFDFFEVVARRNARPGLRPWMLGLLASVATMLLLLGANAARLAGSVTSYDRLNHNPDGSARVARLTPHALAPIEAWKQERLSAVGADTVAETTSLTLIHQRLAQVGHGLQGLAPGTPRERFTAARKIWREVLNKDRFWQVELDEAERNAVTASRELRNLRDRFYELHDHVAADGDALDALFAKADSLLGTARASGVTVTERMESLRALVGLLTAAGEEAAWLEAAPLAGAGYLDGSAVRSVHADLLVPTARLARAAVEQVRHDGAAILDVVKAEQWDQYRAWHFARNNADVAFLATLRPEEKLNPLDRAFYGTGAKGSDVTGEVGPGRTEAVLWLRDRETNRQAYWYFDSKLAYEVKPGGVVDPEPLNDHAFPLRVQNLQAYWHFDSKLDYEVKPGGVVDPTPLNEPTFPLQVQNLLGSRSRKVIYLPESQSRKVIYQPARLEVLGVFLGDGRRPTAGRHALTLTSRDRTAGEGFGFWLPAFLEAVGTDNARALVVGPQPTGEEWKKFVAEMAALREHNGLQQRDWLTRK